MSRTSTSILLTSTWRKLPIFYDEEVIGFGLQVRDDGRKTFTLDNTFEGRRRYSISYHLARSVQPLAIKSSV